MRDRPLAFLACLAGAACARLPARDPIPAQRPVEETTVGPDTSGFRVLLSFPVVDTASVHEAKLGDRLVVRALHERDAAGTSMGWYVAVHQLPVRAESRNLLYHSLAWHGPYPSDVFAWIHREHYYPDDRTLSVYGWPWDVRLVCRDCDVAGDSTRVHFVTGTLEIGVRRLARDNPSPG